MDNLELQIKKAADTIIDRKGTATSVVNRVSTCIISKLNQRNFLKLSHEEVKEIGNDLIIGSPLSYQTWLHRNCFNDLIWELKKNNLIESPYFNIPQQIRRHLIIHYERELWANLIYVKAIHDDLISLKTKTYFSLIEKEEDYVCSFIVSCTLFGKILFPGFEKSILSLKWINVSLDPVYFEIPLNIPPDGEDKTKDTTFYRYFLPPPASIYFLRCVLFYEKNKRNLGIKKMRDSNSFVFPTLHQKSDKFSSMFRRWQMNQVKLKGVNGNGLTLSSFRKAATMASLASPLDISSKISSYPPFIIAIQSRIIKSDSFDKNYLVTSSEERSLPIDNSVRSQKDSQNDSKKDSIKIQHPELKTVINEILGIIRRLNKQSNVRERRTASEKVKSLLIEERINCGLSEDYENVKLYTEWISQMLHPAKTRIRRPSIKTVKDYASNVRTLLFNLSGKGVIYKLTSEDLSRILKQTMGEFNSKAVKTALKSFTDFLITHLGNNFHAVNWKKKELHKQDISTQKPLIHFHQVSEALKKCDDFFCTYLKKYKVTEIQSLKRKVAEHKATVIKHMINLGFYAGIRASEFAHLRVNNVIYDEGIVLCIRTSKTENGIRNIPLHLLVPESYMRDFIIYFDSRRNGNNDDELLFPQYNGSLWDTSHLASEVSRLFESIGIKDVRFHHLRHSFCNWFLLRWFVAFHSEYVPKNLPLLDNELFHEPYIGKITKLIMGMNTHRKGQKIFTYILPMLARLIGHGGPLVTLQKYIHCGDWLFYLLSKNYEGMHVKFSSRQLQDYLQKSYPSLPPYFKGRCKKRLTLSKILNQQILSLQKTYNRSRF